MHFLLAFHIKRRLERCDVKSARIEHRSSPPIPPRIVNRLRHADLNHGLVTAYLQHLAHENTAKSRAILVKADQIADTMGLDDELLDELVVGLGLE
jgi:hypothetical protein